MGTLGGTVENLLEQSQCFFHPFQFHFDMSVHVLVISESVHISLMPDSGGCNTGTKYISTLENCANRNPVSAAAKADDTFPILAALTDCLRF